MILLFALSVGVVVALIVSALSWYTSLITANKVDEHEKAIRELERWRRERLPSGVR